MGHPLTRPLGLAGISASGATLQLPGTERLWIHYHQAFFGNNDYRSPTTNTVVLLLRSPLFSTMFSAVSFGRSGEEEQRREAVNWRQTQPHGEAAPESTPTRPIITAVFKWTWIINACWFSKGCICGVGACSFRRCPPLLTVALTFDPPHHTEQTCQTARQLGPGSLRGSHRRSFEIVYLRINT